MFMDSIATAAWPVGGGGEVGGVGAVGTLLVQLTVIVVAITTGANVATRRFMTTPENRPRGAVFPALDAAFAAEDAKSAARRQDAAVSGIVCWLDEVAALLAEQPVVRNRHARHRFENARLSSSQHAAWIARVEGGLGGSFEQLRQGTAVECRLHQAPPRRNSGNYGRIRDRSRGNGLGAAGHVACVA
jgi:hypothetical protein